MVSQPVKLALGYTSRWVSGEAVNRFLRGIMFALVACGSAFLTPTATAQQTLPPWGVTLCQELDVLVPNESSGGALQYQNGYPMPKQGCTVGDSLNILGVAAPGLPVVQSATPETNNLSSGDVTGSGSMPGNEFTAEADDELSGSAGQGSLSTSTTINVMTSPPVVDNGPVLADGLVQQTLSWLDTITATNAPANSLVNLKVTVTISGNIVNAPAPSAASVILGVITNGWEFTGSVPSPALDPLLAQQTLTTLDGTYSYSAVMPVLVNSPFQLGGYLYTSLYVDGSGNLGGSIQGPDSLVGLPSSPDFTMTVNVDPVDSGVCYTTASGTTYFTGGAPAACGGASAPPLQITPPSQTSIGSGLAYNGAFTATGGSGPPYTWCVLSGSQCDSSQASLPIGFSLNGSGVLSSTGTPPATQGSYPFTVQVTDSGGNSAQQGFNLGILCQISPLTPTPIGQSSDNLPTALIAQFTPPNSQTLSEYAAVCGYSALDWVQTIISWPAPDGVQTDELFAEANPTVPLVAPPAFSDPPSGGYTYMFIPAGQLGAGQLQPKWQATQPNVATAYPFYYSPLDLQSGCATWAGTWPSGFCIPVEKGGGEALNFFDSPQSPECQYPNSCMAFQTQLVGICAPPYTACQGSISSAPIFQWNWASNYNCADDPACTINSGGISTSSINLPPTGVGTGGAAITSINGVPSPTVSVDAEESTIDGLQPLPVAITVNQFAGEPVPAGTVTLTGGSYSSAATTLDGNGGGHDQHSGRFAARWFRYAHCSVHPCNPGGGHLQPGVGICNGDRERRNPTGQLFAQSQLTGLWDANRCGLP